MGTDFISKMKSDFFSKPMKHLMEWSLLLASMMCAKNLDLLYQPHIRHLGTTENIIFLATLTLLEMWSIQHARNAMLRERRYFLPIYVAATFLLGLILFFADIYRDCGLLSRTGPVTNPSSFIYFSFVTWTTTGYGDIVPSAASRLFAGVEAMYGYVFMAVFVAMIGYAMFNSALARALQESSSAPGAASPRQSPPVS
jgi:hypothetical protein